MPLTLQRHEVTAPDGARLSAYVHSPRGLAASAPTVVLAHGWVLSYRSWLPVMRLLADRGDLRLVAWDQRGHGSSTYAGGSLRPRAESVRALGDDLATVIDTLVPDEAPLMLGGHSMGGMTVMAYAGSHPEVFLRRVRRVLLASTAISGVRRKGVPLERRLSAVANRTPGRMRRLVPATAASRQFGATRDASDVAALLAVLRASRIGTYSSYFSALLEYDESRAAETLGQVPVTVVTGTSDALLPHRLSERTAAAIPGAELHVLDGVGHMTPYEAPDLLVRSLLP